MRTLTEIEYTRLDRLAGNWMQVLRFVNDACEDSEMTVRIGAEHILWITANDDGTFKMTVVEA